MKSRRKFATLIILSIFLGVDVEGAQWKENDCQKYFDLISGLTLASAKTLEAADKARKANKEQEAKEMFAASLALSQMAANHTAVYSQFCVGRD